MPQNLSFLVKIANDSNLRYLPLVCLLPENMIPEIQKYFESETGKRDFEEWKVKKKQAGKTAE